MQDEEYDINEPGSQPAEGVLRERTKEEEEEEQKIPVEYLAHVARQRSIRLTRLFYFVFFLVVICGIAPSRKGMDYCPRCGQWRPHHSLAWEHWHLVGLPQDTEWTEWYESLNPEAHRHHWVPAGKVYPGFFVHLTTPINRDLGWYFPDNLVERMREMEPFFRPGKVLDIPRALRAVNNSREWNAIIGPLTMATPEEAFEWWQAHDRELLIWAGKPFGAPLSEEFIEQARQYILEMLEPDGVETPLF